MQSIDLTFGDGKYRFKLGLVQIHELQTKAKAGIGTIFARVLKGRYEVDGQIAMMPTQAEFYLEDLVETVRQGLLGGNHGVVDGVEVKVGPTDVQRLIATYVHDRPLAELWSLAAAILGACMVGFTPPKKDPPPSEGATGADG